ncbi:MAG: Lrp/AsnC family transcriptional regulator [Jatrophihabitans sp.]
MPRESATVNQLEGQIIRCLQLSPRVPFSTVATALSVSEQTVARRYRRLVRAGIVRVTAVVNLGALGQSNWIVRTQCKPSGAESLAKALAQREDVSWVTLVSGGSEIVCVLRARTEEARDDLLIQRLPRTAPVLGIAAAMVLHRFVGEGMHPTDDWAGLADLLDAGQQRTVLQHGDLGLAEPVRNADGTQRTTLEDTDRLLLDALARDGRASFAAVAQAGGVSETTATRRLRALFAAGEAYLDVDLSAAALGYHAAATLWLTVTPAELDRAGQALAGEREVAFVGAITGQSNLTASVVCRDTAALYRFVTDKVGAIAGVQSMEVSPVLRHIKQAGTLTVGDRLAESS